MSKYLYLSFVNWKEAAIWSRINHVPATVTNGEIRGLHLLLLAGIELLLERAVFHSIDEEVGARAEINVLNGLDAAGRARLCIGERGGDAETSRDSSRARGAGIKPSDVG